MKNILTLFAVSLVLMPSSLKAQGDTEIFFSFPSNPNRESNGIYSFTAGDPSQVTARKTAPEFYFTQGTGYQNGHIYGMTYTQGFFTPDRYTLYDIDMRDWSYTQQDVDKKLALKETANGANGTTYALFTDGTLGTIDYAHRQRTTIYTPTRDFVALGVNSIDELYGIDSDRHVVRINTANGQETDLGQVDMTWGYGNKTGEIDPVTGLFYLAAATSWNANYTIFAIDLATLTATDCGQLPPGYDYVDGMIILGEPSAAGAPAKATGLKATFEGNALSGTFQFTAPTLTFDHKTLEGELYYTVEYGTADGAAAQLKGTTQPGAQVTLPLTLQQGGMVTFTVRLSNSAGEGQSATLQQWIGPDAPLPPTGVTLTMSADGTATLTWQAPTACVNGGYMGLLTYDVYRIVSGEETLVAHDLGTTTFTEQHQVSTLQEYSYAVVASNEGTLSQRALSNKVIAGEGFGVPFTEHFGEGNHLEYFTVVNVNHDEDRWGELTWKLHTDMTFWGAGQSYEEMWVQTDGATDDWLITPPLQFKGANLYALTFRMKVGNADTPEAFEVRMGDDADIRHMTIPLMAERTITNTDYVTFRCEFRVFNDTQMCIGFHATPHQGVALYLDDIEVRQATSPDAPAAPQFTGLFAGEKGELKATIEFLTPEYNIGAQPLGGLTKVELLRDEELIATLDHPAVNTQYTIVDDQPANGYHNYTLVPYNEAGRGESARYDSLYVGIDLPQAPHIRRIEDHGNRVRVEWDAADIYGQRGYYVSPEDVSYEVYATDMATGRRADLLYQGKERTFEAGYQDTDDFDLVKWIVVARNVAGSSTDGVAKMATGCPLTLPYRETFAMGALKTSIWTEQSGVRSWNPTTEDAVGTDAGSLLYVPYAHGDVSAYCTQRLTFVGVRQPQLSFYTKIESGVLRVEAWQPSGEQTVLTSVTAAQAADWQKFTVDLTPLKQQKYVVLKFIGQGEPGRRMLIDDVLICDGAYADGIEEVNVHHSSPITHHSYDLMGRRHSSLTRHHSSSTLQVRDGRKVVVR